MSQGTDPNPNPAAPTAPAPAPAPAPAVDPNAPKPAEPTQDNEAAKWRRLAEKAEADAKAARTEAETLKAAEQQRKDAELSDLEREKKRAAEAEAERDRLKQENLQRKVAAEHNVPADMIEFLTGTDEATLIAQAQKLAARVVPGTEPPKQAGTQTQPPRGVTPTMQERIAEADKRGKAGLLESIRLRREQAGFTS